MYYFDNASTTQDLYSSCIHRVLGNPDSSHLYGDTAARILQECRIEIATYINAKSPNQIIFTSGGTESNNLAILGIADFLENSNKKHIVTDMVEHSSVYECMKVLEKRGFSVTYLYPDVYGEISPEMVSNAITENTGLVSIMHVNNETGTMFDLKGIGEVCKKNGILFHSDCVQSFAAIPIDVENFNLDFISVSGHKFHAPKGVGFLYAREPEKLHPLVYGGGQEFGIRSGTVNVNSINAMSLAMIDGMKATETIDRHRKYITGELTGNIKGVHINGNPNYNGCRIINVRFDGVNGETLMSWLSCVHRIAVSTGAACDSHAITPSRVLLSFGLSPEEARSSIRISLSRINTDHEMSILVEKIKDSVELLRGLSSE